MKSVDRKSDDSYFGYIYPKYKNIAKSFKENYLMKNEVGASLCVYHKNKKVIDIWGGMRDVKNKLLWKENTVIPILSASKAVFALCMCSLRNKAAFEYGDLVSKYWVDFGENLKDKITIDELLQHRAGLVALPGVSNRLHHDIREHDQLLAQQSPIWKSGAYQGYHQWTIDLYIDALVRRIDPLERSVKEFFETEMWRYIEGEIYIGTEHLIDKSMLAYINSKGLLLPKSVNPRKMKVGIANPFSITFQSVFKSAPVLSKRKCNQIEVLSNLAANNILANAKGLASLFNRSFIDYSPIKLKSEVISELFEYPKVSLVCDKDKVLNQASFLLDKGFMKPSVSFKYSPTNKCIAAFGETGSFVQVDLENELVIALTTNDTKKGNASLSTEGKLLQSVYESL